MEEIDGSRVLRISESTVFEDLKRPFDSKTEILWRVGRSGYNKQSQPYVLCLAYVDARALRKRLNEVLSPIGWRVEYKGVGSACVCRLWLNINGEWHYKEDGAGETKVEAEKGMISDAFKRACMCWGIGEYLYDLGDSWGNVKRGWHDEFRFHDKILDNNDKKVWHSWDAPAMPIWALSEEEKQRNKEANIKKDNSFVGDF